MTEHETQIATLPPHLLAYAEHVPLKNYRAVRRRLDGTTVLMAHQLRTDIDAITDEIWSLIDGERTIAGVANVVAKNRNFQLVPCLLFTIEVMSIFLDRRLIELASTESAQPKSCGTLTYGNRG
jgi:hypothetical protein